MSDVLRIIDANANRAREAMRVMEDAARFLLDDSEISGLCKTLRHDLAEALSAIPGSLQLHRDTPGDVGTRISTPREGERASAADVAIAAGKRLSEALRTIEEYAKTLGGQGAGVAGNIEALRYRGYEVERLLNQRLGASARRQWRLCVLVSESLCNGRPWMEIAAAAVEGGADCIQLREKDLDAGEMLIRARALVETCRPAGVSVIINDRPDVALLSGADGVHLGQTDLPCTEVRKLVGRQLLIGVSTSNLDQAKQAFDDGADYCGVGPMFETTTKHKPILAGPAYLREYVEWGKLPHLAIGGIKPSNIGELVEVGGRGVAVSSAVCASDDPGAACRKLLDQLSR